MVLAGLVSLALALLSIGALEPQISRNHADTVRARYLAESGLEHAYDVLTRDASAWPTHLAGSTCTTGAVLLDAPVPGRAASEGHVRVVVRNDCAPGDERVTGVPREKGIEDANRRLVVISTGTVERLTYAMTAAAEGGQTVPPKAGRTYNWSER
jgi:Tfp pilus assembly protein PilX